MVFQNPDNQIIASVVEEDVAFGPENLGVPSEEIRKRVDAALDDVGMLEYAKHEPHRLSGGQKQRIAIAGVVAMKPECIIFDEPTAMLDPKGRAEIMAIIDELHKEGITVVLITHHMDEAARAQRVVVLHKGGIVADTHCIRISGRLGLADGKDPLKTERALSKLIPLEKQSDFCHRMVLFGREVCIARNPKCGECKLKEFCEFYNIKEIFEKEIQEKCETLICNYSEPCEFMKSRPSKLAYRGLFS